MSAIDGISLSPSISFNLRAFPFKWTFRVIGKAVIPAIFLFDDFPLSPLLSAEIAKHLESLYRTVVHTHTTLNTLGAISQKLIARHIQAYNIERRAIKKREMEGESDPYLGRFGKATVAI